MKTSTFYRWAVVGAGPAGIAAVGQLLDHGIPAKDIAWVDPTFTVGDFGTKWAPVSSNTTVKLFTDFLQACLSFEYDKCPQDFELANLDPMQNCELSYMVEPLQWVTEQLKAKVQPIQDKIHQLSAHEGYWQLKGEQTEVLAQQVILAIGSEPKSLTHTGVEEIPLITALDKAKLTQACGADDVVAVFGSSHSAIIAVRYLLEAKVKHVVNFYRTPLCYAVKTDDGFLFDDTGLKGQTAVWAKAHLHGQVTPSLTRVYADSANVARHLPDCQKVIYAVGFQRRALPILDDLPHLEYNPYNGIIAPGLFGLGIAFPEAKIDRYNTVEYRVGLWKFMDYLNRIMPLWLSYR
jgi:cation diffusion facilitator CzcD-associated flavoprotein CzcO